MFPAIQADQVLFRQVLSFIGLMFLALVESALGQVPTFYGAAPKLVFCMLFVISVRFPRAAPLLPVMLVGLVFDVIQASPFGYTSSQYLIILTYSQIRQIVLAEADATSLWVEFTLVVFIIIIYMMIIFSLYTGALPPFSEMVFQIGLTVLLFPIVNWVFDIYKNISFYFGARK
ncbi:MAG: hypothetical protein ACNYPF_02760 [Candidatus Puniceispirillales bacterium WSBS_2018_MAG_OTU23]